MYQRGAQRNSHKSRGVRPKIREIPSRTGRRRRGKEAKRGKVRREKLSPTGRERQDGWKFFRPSGIRRENWKVTSQFPGGVHALSVALRVFTGNETARAMVEPRTSAPFGYEKTWTIADRRNRFLVRLETPRKWEKIVEITFHLLDKLNICNGT